MTTYIGLLRAVNLTVHSRVKMSDLCAVAARAGVQSPRTLLASGNLLFDSDSEDADALARLLESAVEAKLGLRTTIFVRTPPEWRRLVKDNPFTEAAAKDPAHLLAVTLSAPPGRAAIAALNAAIAGPESVSVKGRNAYAVYPDGVGTSKLTTALIERKLGTRCTGRNWNTVLKIAASLA